MTERERVERVERRTRTDWVYRLARLSNGGALRGTGTDRRQAHTEPLYPCAHPGCTTMRTKAEGGTTFTVCDEHWDVGRENARHESWAMAAVEEREGKAVDVLGAWEAWSPTRGRADREQELGEVIALASRLATELRATLSVGKASADIPQADLYTEKPSGVHVAEAAGATPETREGPSVGLVYRARIEVVAGGKVVRDWLFQTPHRTELMRLLDAWNEDEIAALVECMDRQPLRTEATR